MKSFSSRKLAIGATGLVLLAGAGGAVAVAATQGSAGSGRQAYIDDVAKHLNVSPSALTAAMTAARNDQIEAAVAAGRITQSQADALKQRNQQSGSAPFFGHGFASRGFGSPHGFGGPGGPGGFGGQGGFGAAAAQYLGISPATLHTELESGKSLYDIASSTPGKSVEGLKAAVIGAAKTQLAKAVSSGWITTQQEQERLGNLSSQIGALLQRNGVGGPNGGPGGGHRGGPAGGPSGGPGGGPSGGPGFGLFGR